MFIDKGVRKISIGMRWRGNQLGIPLGKTGRARNEKAVGRTKEEGKLLYVIEKRFE